MYFSTEQNKFENPASHQSCNKTDVGTPINPRPP